MISLKDKVLQLGQAGTDAVSIVRDSFADGSAPFMGSASGSVPTFLDTFVKDRDASQVLKDTSGFGVHSSPGTSPVPVARPELDSAEVVEAGQAGVIDSFCIRLTISLTAVDARRTDTVKIYRADMPPVKVPRPTIGALVDSPARAGKSLDPLFAAAQRGNDLGVGNQVTSFVADDPNAPGRTVISEAQRQLRVPEPPLNTNKDQMGASGLLDLAGADRSVLEDLTFYINRRSQQSLQPPPPPPLDPGNQSGFNILRGNSVSNATVQESNAAGFKAIATVPTKGLTARVVGQIVEITYVDKSVVHGASYMYYVACPTEHGGVGPRSRMVRVDVVRTVPPPQPQVLYSVTAGHPRFTIRAKRGSNHIEVYRSGRAAALASVMGSEQSLIVEGPSNQVGDFYHVGDIGLGFDGSTCFIDTDAVPGDELTYRFYAVDPYGLKSQTPFSCTVKVPAHGERIPLAVPSLTTEQVTAGAPAVQVRAMVDDPRIKMFFFSRRDITIGERAVHQANQPELFTFGVPNPKRAGSRASAFQQDTDWPSFLLCQSGSASFVDTTARLDRTYQYGVYGVDVKGNRTFMVGAPPVALYSKPTIDPPTGLTAQIQAPGGKLTGILLTWTPGTVDFSPNQLVSDQDVLAATSVRSVFQVERRSGGSSFWEAMPATTESWFMDSVSDKPAPNFRPDYVTLGSTYQYRVISMQSGGFISPRTDSISVRAITPPQAVDSLYVRSTPLAVRPLCAIVSWDGSAAFVSHWQVQRAAANKIFAAKIRSVDSDAARSLDYTTVATVTPEASRAAGLASDGARDLDRSIYVGSRFYVDSDVSPNNSYFYRTRTVGVDGSMSGWVYAGIHFNDYAVDRKFVPTLSDDQKVTMVSDPRPIPPSLPTGPLLTQVTQVEAIPSPTPLNINVQQVQEATQVAVDLQPVVTSSLQISPLFIKTRSFSF